MLDFTSPRIQTRQGPLAFSHAGMSKTVANNNLCGYRIGRAVFVLNGRLVPETRGATL